MITPAATALIVSQVCPPPARKWRIAIWVSKRSFLGSNEISLFSITSSLLSGLLHTQGVARLDILCVDNHAVISSVPANTDALSLWLKTRNVKLLGAPNEGPSGLAFYGNPAIYTAVTNGEGMVVASQTN